MNQTNETKTQRSALLIWSKFSESESFTAADAAYYLKCDPSRANTVLLTMVVDGLITSHVIKCKGGIRAHYCKKASDFMKQKWGKLPSRHSLEMADQFGMGHR